MYRNILYSPKDEIITLFTWDGAGNRVAQEFPYKPYLYIEDPSSKDGMSIYNKPLKKLEFESSYKRKEFVKNIKQVYHNIQPEQQFLIDRFSGQNKLDSFSNFPLKIYFLDIETFSQNGFPQPTEANDPIILISIFDSTSGYTTTFGVGNEYYTSDDTVIYNCFEDEESMIKGFLRWWRKDFPDIVSGWNSDGFDIPYICNRINKIYEDPKACNKLSPVGRTYCFKDAKRRLGATEKIYDQLWTISGITSIDYMSAYIVFTKDKRESYALNAIAEEELQMGKLAHNAVSLSELAKTDWHKFVDYNIQDVRLLVLLEDKLKYLKTCRELAYSGLSPLNASLNTVGIVTGMAVQKAKERNKVIPTFEGTDVTGNFEGGFVKEPVIGISKSLLYYDANSLYPNTIVTLNISNETKVGTFIVSENGDYEVTTVAKKKVTLSPENFRKVVDKEKLAITKSNILFTQKIKGIFPEIIEELYSKRVALKATMKKIDTEKSKIFNKSSDEYLKLATKSQFFDSQQFTIKILMNRIYGYFAEKHSPLYDIDMASSVTLTGQACIKEASRIIEQHFKDLEIADDPIIYNDTDSVVITIEPILKKDNQPFLINGEINPHVHVVAKRIKDTIDSNINKWAISELNSLNSRYEFKQENISQSGIFLKKKHYILNIRDDEGIPKDVIKYTGVEIKRTTTPKKIKPLIDNTIRKLIKTGDKKLVDETLKDAYEYYLTLKTDDKATSMSVNNYDKYSMKANDLKFASKTPRQVCCAIAYNFLLKKYNLDNKYETIKSGDKIKLMYVEPNKFGLDSIGFKYAMPEEFNKIFKMDDKRMFEKTFFKAVDRVFKAIDWKVRNPVNDETLDLFDFFGVLENP
jgi:DNA polymerase elongation subunit (family B)